MSTPTPIVVRGAREHNLQAVDLDLPRGALIVFCGVSGSGKSSLAFDTLFVEGQRRYLEALAIHRGRGPSLVPPRVDRIDGLPPTIALAQRAGAYGPRSTVGSVAELDPVLRILFGRTGVAHCPRCGRPVTPSTHDEIVGALLALPLGTRLTLEAPLRTTGPGLLDEVQRAGFGRLRINGEIQRIEDVRTVPEGASARIVVDRIKIEADRGSRLADSVRLAARAGHGVVIAVHDGPGGSGEATFVDRPVCVHDDLPLPALEPSLLSPWGPPGACPTCDGLGRVDDAACPACAGTRLSEVARAVTWRGRSFAEVEASTVDALAASLAVGDPNPIEAVAVPDLRRRLDRMRALGLGGLRLADPIDALSGSEVQRLRLVRQVATGLSGVLVVLDEPVAGLEPRLAEVVVGVIRELVDAGNTVIAVEHAPEVIRAADHAVEFGPGAGVDGGRVVYQGPVAGLLAADTATGRWLSGRSSIPARAVELPTSVTVSGPWLRGRPSPAVRIARGGVVAITGPAGTGKSTLIALLATSLTGGATPGVTLSGAEGLARPILADRAAAKAARSNPATYVGLWDTVRELLASTRDAAIRGLNAGAFSLSTPGGRCEACKGTGERVIELGPLPDVIQQCPVCDGRRFQRDVLEVRWKGLDAAEILASPAARVHPILAGHPRLDDGLRALLRVGLGYVPLGQPVHTLSGGEARLLALARELARAHRRGADDTVYLLDDPTVGLHPQDVGRLVELLRALCDEGATAWLATVDPGLIGAADRVVTLGP
ncbi:MAG: ABC-ATPase UvrA [Myxococcota bacterium]